MPYVSRAQQGLFHSKNSPVSPKVVKEWDEASRGERNLPYHVGKGSNPVMDKAVRRRMSVMRQKKKW